MTLLSTTEQNRSLDLFYGATKGAGASASHEVALFTDDPALGGTELAASGGYVRVTVANDGTTWPDAAADGEKTSAVVDFATSTDAWSDTAKWFVLYAVDSGEQADGGELSEEISVDEAGVDVSTELTIYYENLGA